MKKILQKKPKKTLTKVEKNDNMNNIKDKKGENMVKKIERNKESEDNLQDLILFIIENNGKRPKVYEKNKEEKELAFWCRDQQRLYESGQLEEDQILILQDFKIINCEKQEIKSMVVWDNHYKRYIIEYVFKNTNSLTETKERRFSPYN